jgi:hypothetical protein
MFLLMMLCVLVVLGSFVAAFAIFIAMAPNGAFARTLGEIQSF